MTDDPRAPGYPQDSQGSQERLEDRLEVGEAAEVQDHLRFAAHQLANRLVAVQRPGRRKPLTAYLDEYRSIFQQALRSFRSAGEQELTLSYAAEWMLDNYHLVEQALREIEGDLPSRYYRQLPKLVDGVYEDIPRIYEIARVVIQLENAHLDMEHIRRFIRAYQEAAPLTIGELWAFPSLLRLGILQSLALAVARITEIPLADPALPLVDLSEQMTDEEVVANTFISLRTIDAEDWKDFFESLSLVERILRKDPAGIYPGMDFETRDRYRKVVEELALSTSADEQAAAQAAVQMALSSAAGIPVELKNGIDGRGRSWKESDSQGWDSFSSPQKAHVGYFLLGDGRDSLERYLRYRPSPARRLKRWIFSHPAGVYVGSIALLTILVVFLAVGAAAAAGGETWRLVLAGLLVLLPAVTASVDFVNWVITNSVEPRVFAKMDFSRGIPSDCRTMVVIPALISSLVDVQSLLQQLEQHFLRNADPQLTFALLTDFADAPQEKMPEDGHLIEAARSGLNALNEKYGTPAYQPFYLFHRERRWNPKEGTWMGWERKRGKLHEFNHLILGEKDSSYAVQIGRLELLPNIRYVITLDADTILPRDSAQRLVATLTHPLNRARFDPSTGELSSGYSVLQPRTEVNPAGLQQSIFTRVFAGDTGLDLYTLAVSDVYQDLFGEGIYVGKGIYDVRAFERSLDGRIPENALLSHDLFEGIYGRVGLVTDIVLIEDFPSNYLVYMNRMHRWIRGDWQISPWLLPRVPSAKKRWDANHLSFIDRWKILDNLRRSLAAPALVLLLIAGWWFLPGSPVFWTLAGAASLAVPLVMTSVSALLKWVQGQPSRQALRSVVNSAVRWLLAIAFLPYEAYVALNAVGITLLRLVFTRRQMLQWTTSAQSTRHYGDELTPKITFRQMLAGLVLAGSIFILLLLANLEGLWAALPVLALWLLSPEIAAWVSRPIRYQPAPLSGEERQALRNLARQTWLFFEQYVGPEDQWLPPDHFQEEPLGIVAHRTSPTNIGLSMLASLGAYDLGYIGALDLAARLQTTFESLHNLERYRGHFLNWYETHNLEPLPPRYVSTVDSGNLAASLIALGQGCLRLGEARALRWESWQGLLDILDLTRSLLLTGDDRQDPGNQTPLIEQIDSLEKRILAVREHPEQWAGLWLKIKAESWQTFDQMLMQFVEEYGVQFGSRKLRQLRAYTFRTREHLEKTLREMALLLPWLTALEAPPRLFIQAGTDAGIAAAWQRLVEVLPVAPRLSEIAAVADAGRSRLDELVALLPEVQASPELYEEACDWCSDLSESLRSAGMAAKVLWIGFDEMYRSSQSYIRQMDFGFLFDRKRQVFHIGYNLDLEKLDANYYDLMASEARIASLVAIATGEIPQSHWLHLSRPFTTIDGSPVLLSWSATMFEYLMPALLVKSYEGTLLHQTMRGAVERHIQYASQKDVPWGMSESGYYRFDANLFYQYRAFGVPGLGYKRGLGDDLVIAPYASLLALPMRPKAVLENVASLEKLGMRGIYGLYEAIDFTPTRLVLGQDSAIVRSYMAHHQGMIFLALTNYFKNDIMVQRFHADPHIQSVELLLQEQIPQNVPIQQPHAEDTRDERQVEAKVVANPWKVPLHTPQPRVHFLSNGRYGLLISSCGSGYSTWEDVDLTRWRADTTLNDWGMWIYLQDLDSGALWSAGHQPAAAAESRDIFFNAHMAEFRVYNQEINCTMEIGVAPDDDVEMRRITLVNNSSRPRRLRLTSYAEVILAAQASDQRHPAFNKLFIQSEYLAEENMLLFRRRPRSEEEAPIFAGHTLFTEEETELTRAYEGDREMFLGRGGTVRSPQALTGDRWLTGSVGATLDPILSLGQVIELEPHASTQVTFLTLAARSRQEAVDLAQRYRSWQAVERAFNQARSQAEVELRRLGLAIDELERIQKLLSFLIFPSAALRAGTEVLRTNDLGQPGLWPYSISGDYPILLVKLESVEDLPVVQELLQAHAYWRSRKLKVDLVILNMQGADYGQELNAQLLRLIGRLNSDAWLNRRGGIFLLLRDQLGEAGMVLVQTAARVILDAAGGLLHRQLEGLDSLPARLPRFSPAGARPEFEEKAPALGRPSDLLFDNGWGGFSPDGTEYVIYLENGQWTPAPWVNVIANPAFGFLATEAGGGYTWAVNSGENRLTTWSNDPVSDMPAEILYLRDEETAEVWTPTPLPAGGDGPFLIRHGAGYTEYEHDSHDLRQRMRLFAAPDDPVKIIHLRVENRRDLPRRLTATFYAEMVLGVNRDMSQQYLIPEYEAESQTLLVRNPYNAEFGELEAFVAASEPLHGLTTDRTEFLGRMGSRAAPAALQRVGLAGAIQAGVDPCAALQMHIDLPAGGAEELHFILGQGLNREDALRLAVLYKDPNQAQAAWQGARAFWDDLLGTVSVRTPDRAMDLMLNRWLLYQALSCRIWGRSGFYQSSGAYGFRDQLQDVMALVFAAPELTREQILRAARHQFEAGDVLHWWHPPSGRGVRTRISDDLLWLPYVTANYIKATGDDSVLDEQAPFLSGALLGPDEEERYGHYESTRISYTIYEHCRRAIEKGFTSGRHNLPLIGAGDWNDGMNRVGAGGRGESVWLGWFLYDTLMNYAEVIAARGEVSQAEVYRQRASDLRQALNDHAWDGAWYLRAFYDDGAPLGSARNRECKIDSIAQSWAVLSEAGDPEKARRAMQAVQNRLVREEDQLLLLFTPPFDQTARDPGYIKGYLPGIRENGGQYTHAATWAVWAYTRMGLGDEAEALYRLLNPVYHADRPEKARRYQVEPYVAAADVYSMPPHVGRGGWTWYTGSSGWMYRLGLEAILGLRLEGGQLVVDPRIPKTWQGYAIVYRSGESRLDIEVENPRGVSQGVRQVLLDGEVLPDGKIPIPKDGRVHRVKVIMG